MIQDLPVGLTAAKRQCSIRSTQGGSEEDESPSALIVLLSNASLKGRQNRIKDQEFGQLILKKRKERSDSMVAVHL